MILRVSYGLLPIRALIDWGIGSKPDSQTSQDAFELIESLQADDDGVCALVASISMRT
jgi:hypothetical protein